MYLSLTLLIWSDVHALLLLAALFFIKIDTKKKFSPFFSVCPQFSVRATLFNEKLIYTSTHLLFNTKCFTIRFMCTGNIFLHFTFREQQLYEFPMYWVSLEILQDQATEGCLCLQLHVTLQITQWLIRHDNCTNIPRAFLPFSVKVWPPFKKIRALVNRATGTTGQKTRYSFTNVFKGFKTDKSIMIHL